MSLTNPDKVVTEERLNEYHQTILPYLGGMPDILANKFSRADLYSTDEKMIGRWIDGKPLYQKTIIDTAQTGWFDIPHNIANIDKVVDTQIGFIHSNAYYKIGCAYSNDSMSASTVGRTNIGIYNSVAAYNGDEVIATIKYTKTTDSAVEIGLDTDYSTDEKIIGTWVDGKPIYQKTVDCGALPNATEKTIAHGISNIDFITGIFGISKRNSDNRFYPLPFVNTSQSAEIRIDIVGDNIRIETSIDYTAFTTTYVTLQYTKTTD